MIKRSLGEKALKGQLYIPLAILARRPLQSIEAHLQKDSIGEDFYRRRLLLKKASIEKCFYPRRLLCQERVPTLSQFALVLC